MGRDDGLRRLLKGASHRSDEGCSFAPGFYLGPDGSFSTIGFRGHLDVKDKCGAAKRAQLEKTIRLEETALPSQPSYASLAGRKPMRAVEEKGREEKGRKGDEYTCGEKRTSTCRKKGAADLDIRTARPAPSKSSVNPG
jgi:hypothetical protein